MMTLLSVTPMGTPRDHRWARWTGIYKACLMGAQRPCRSAVPKLRSLVFKRVTLMSILGDHIREIFAYWWWVCESKWQCRGRHMNSTWAWHLIIGLEMSFGGRSAACSVTVQIYVSLDAWLMILWGLW